MKSLFVSSSSSTPSHMNVLLASAVCLLMLLGCSSTVEAKPVVVTKCSAGYSLSITPCSKSATSSAPLGGSGYCCSCPGGSFSDGTTCKTCSASTPSTTVSGVDTQKWGAVCFCLDGFGDYDLNTMSCRRCPANTYSSNNKCVPCAAGTFAAAQSSVCAAVKCPADSYLPPGGATVSDCTRCKFGTAGQSCSNVQGCRCSAGYAAFNKTTGACQACANTNSIAVYANFDKPDETNTVCANCPTGTVASSDRRTCTATTATGTGSSTTTTSTGTTNKAATTATTTSTTTSTTSSSTSTTTSTTTTPYPSNPIPLLTCPGSSFTGCIGGYDYEITISQLQATAVTTLNHAMATTAAAASITLDKRTPWSVSGNYVFTDETDIPIAALTYTQTAGQFFTKNQAAFRSKFADTCGQTMYNLGVMGTCVKLKSGAAATSIKTAFATTSNLATNFDVAVKATCYAGSALVTQCSTTATASTSTTTTTATASTVSMTLLDTSKTTTSIITAASTTNSAGVSYAISGSGTSSFGSNVIAIVDANNIVKFVLAAPPNNNKGNVLITTAHAAYGKTCAKGVNNVAACVALNYQLTDVAPDMNNVVKGAANSPLLIAGSCTNNN